MGAASFIWIEVLVGLVLVLFGRRLFWLFVAVAGFLLGADAAGRWVSGEATWLVWAAALLAGIVGALLAVFLQKAAVVIAGGLAGAWVALEWAQTAGLAEPIPWIAAVALGLISAALAYFVFEWALILLSALVGVSLAVGPLPLEAVWKGAVATLLFIVGVVVQFLTTRRRAAVPPP
ncbi:MAG: hypothetical protein SFU53_12850 [Terrimicrobiaceae bacterium]|nr:hypothetical protein [Terrimicrobiaceae bacterium]